MSMSEIQEAAEIITSAVSPDANIIFGATLKPDLEDELIITVIATGFDNEYFKEQAEKVERPGSTDTMQPNIDEAVAQIDSEKETTNPAEHFAAEPTHNIWDEPKENDEDDTPAFLRRRKKNQQGEE